MISKSPTRRRRNSRCKHGDKCDIWAGEGSACVFIPKAFKFSRTVAMDPYELYKHMHPSDVGTCIGSGMGDVISVAQLFKDR